LSKRTWRNPGVCFLEVDKTYVDLFGILPRFLKSLLESKNLVCNAKARTKSALGINRLWFDYVAIYFFKELGMHFSMEAKKIDSPVVGL